MADSIVYTRDGRFIKIRQLPLSTRQAMRGGEVRVRRKNKGGIWTRRFAKRFEYIRVYVVWIHRSWLPEGATFGVRSFWDPEITGTFGPVSASDMFFIGHIIQTARNLRKTVTWAELEEESVYRWATEEDEIGGAWMDKNFWGESLLRIFKPVYGYEDFTPGCSLPIYTDLRTTVPRSYFTIKLPNGMCVSLVNSDDSLVAWCGNPNSPTLTEYFNTIKYEPSRDYRVISPATTHNYRENSYGQHVHEVGGDVAAQEIWCYGGGGGLGVPSEPQGICPRCEQAISPTYCNPESPGGRDEGEPWHWPVCYSWVVPAIVVDRCVVYPASYQEYTSANVSSIDTVYGTSYYRTILRHSPEQVAGGARDTFAFDGVRIVRQEQYLGVAYIIQAYGVQPGWPEDRPFYVTVTEFNGFISGLAFYGDSDLPEVGYNEEIVEDPQYPPGTVYGPFTDDPGAFYHAYGPGAYDLISDKITELGGAYQHRWYPLIPKMVVNN